MSPSPMPTGPRRGSGRRQKDDDEESVLANLRDDELLVLISEGEFTAEESCEAVEEALRRGLESEDAAALMRDALFGFEASTIRYRAAVSLVRMNQWDNDVHRALCQAVLKLPVDEPLARSARLQLQKRGFSSGIQPERPRVGTSEGLASPPVAKPEQASPPRTIREPAFTSQSPAPPASPARTSSSSQSSPVLPRYTADDIEEPRIHYRRRKRKHGELLRQVLSNLQVFLLFVVAFVVFLLLLARY